MCFVELSPGAAHVEYISPYRNEWEIIFLLDKCFLLEQLPSSGHGFPPLWLIRMCDNRVLRRVVQKPWNKD